MPDTCYSILHIITRLDCGGSAENTLLTSIGFAEKKHNVTIIYGNNHPSSENEKIAREAGVTFVRCKHLVRNISPINDLLSCIHIFKYIKSNNYTILHTHTSKAGIIGRVAGKLGGIPYIVHTPHGHIFYGYFSNLITRIFILIEWFTVKWTHAHIALTKKEKEDYLIRHIGRSNRTYVIYSGISMNNYLNPIQTKKDIKKQLGFDDTHFICATVARLDPIKNHDMIIDAALLLKEYENIFRFLFIGDGELTCKLKTRIQQLGLNSMFLFLGWRKDVHEILPGCDCFVLCSKNEGMGRAFVEAQAAGLPVIGSRVCGIPEVVVEGITGYLVEPDNTKELAEKIVMLYNKKDKMKNVALECRNWVNPRFSISTMIDKIESVYAYIMSR